MARETAAAPPVPGLYELERWHRWWEAARTSPAVGSAGRPAGEPDGSPASGDDGNGAGAGIDDLTRPSETGVAVGVPYRGLEPFRAGDTRYFFGREKAIAAVAETTRIAATSGRGLAMVVAASGAGKSSLLRAGLQSGVDAGTQQIWPEQPGCAVVLTPGADPVAALLAVLPALGMVVDGLERGEDTDATSDAAAFGLDPGEAEPAEASGQCFPQRVRAAVAEEAGRRAGPGARLVVIVDQLEELFTLCEDPVQRQWFVRLLAAATDGVGAPAVVVAGLRADLYHRCLNYPPLARALQRDQMVLPAMTATELRAAVTGPARAVGLKVEPALLDVVLAEAGVAPRPGGRRGTALEPGLLPLVSHVLRATWERRQGGRLTPAGYRAAGGIHGAVSTTAERAIAGMAGPQQAAALRLLVSLTRVDEENRDTRRRCAREALLAGSADPDAARRALEVLVGERLVSVDTDMVEIAHDALLTAWPRLREHLNRHRAGLRLAQQLDEAAAAWEAQQCAPDLLFRGTQLEASEAGVGGEDGQLSGRAQRFLAASAHQRRVAARAGRSRRRRGRAAVAAIAVLAVASLVFAGLAVESAGRADVQRDDARLAQVLATADRIRPQDASVAAQLYLVAGRMRPGDPQVQGRILSTQQWPLARPLPGSTGAIYDAAYSPDGHTLATATENHTVALWNLTDPTHPRLWSSGLVAGPGWISAAVFSPDGHTLAATGQDGLVRLWDVTDPAHPIPLGSPLDAHAGSASLLAFSPDGATVATANDDHTVRLWNVTDPAHATPEAVLTGHTGIVRTVAFSPDGHLLASGADDKTTLLWDVHDLARPVRVGPTLTGHDAAVHSVAFSPDSALLATGSDDSSARLWDVSTPTTAHPIGKALQVHRGSIWSVAFSPDGHRLAVGSQDGSASVWSVITPAAPTPVGDRLVTTTGGILAVTFSPDGNTLVTGGSDGTTLLWSSPPRMLLGPTDRVFTVAFSPDGQTLAGGSHDHNVWL
ncbi:AAA family ATPase [uncultured Pseudonocardia sp.]|uniref:nSTAND1 domain-containing NTPase n=1 Tax=uncultured Pseudonocardia sp. TaxID=211455 RepID=UPI0026084062|nr:AAA family ATPase [uncultured Pseudonocardia sp.]